MNKKSVPIAELKELVQLWVRIAKLGMALGCENGARAMLACASDLQKKIDGEKE